MDTVPSSIRADLMTVAITAEERAEDALMKISEFDKVKIFLPDRAASADEMLATWQVQYEARRDRAVAIWERLGALTDEEREAIRTRRISRWKRELKAAEDAQPRFDEMAMHPEIWATTAEEIEFDQKVVHDGATSMSASQLRIDAAQNRARCQAVAEYLATSTDSESSVALPE